MSVQLLAAEIKAHQPAGPIDFPDGVRRQQHAEFVRRVEDGSPDDSQDSRNRICGAIEAKYTLAA